MTHLSLYLCFLLQRFHLVVPVYSGVERNDCEFFVCAKLLTNLC